MYAPLTTEGLKLLCRAFNCLAIISDAVDLDPRENSVHFLSL